MHDHDTTRRAPLTRDRARSASDVLTDAARSHPHPAARDLALRKLGELLDDTGGLYVGLVEVEDGPFSHGPGTLSIDGREVARVLASALDRATVTDPPPDPPTLTHLGRPPLHVPIVADHTVEEGTAEFRLDGRVVGRIVNLGDGR